jgi:transposase
MLLVILRGFHITLGQAHDLQGSDVLLLPEIKAATVIADKVYDADKRVITPLTNAGKTVVIPPKKSRKVQRFYDKHLYKTRHLIKNFFEKIKQYRAIATRYDKTASNFLGAIYIAASVISLN